MNMDYEEEKYPGRICVSFYEDKYFSEQTKELILQKLKSSIKHKVYEEDNPPSDVSIFVPKQRILVASYLQFKKCEIGSTETYWNWIKSFFCREKKIMQNKYDIIQEHVVNFGKVLEYCKSDSIAYPWIIITDMKDNEMSHSRFVTKMSNYIHNCNMPRNMIMFITKNDLQYESEFSRMVRNLKYDVWNDYNNKW